MLLAPYLYKAGYYPLQADDPFLWNPRLDAPSAHFFVLADGMLRPRTATGAFTIRRLRLNRAQLIAFRLYQQEQAEQVRLLTTSREMVRELAQLLRQQAALLEAQQGLLSRQQSLLEALLEGLDR